MRIFESLLYMMLPVIYKGHCIEIHEEEWEKICRMVM